MSEASKDKNVENVAFKDALGERYLAYALSTIMARSLPDVRDGLKPVHRRLLHAMRLLKLEPSSGYKKCARVVGDVIGKYHPHGDVAVYDTMVRLAQSFAVRYPLVDGQGNFGSIDGDNAAAMRYTEARLTAVAMALLDGLDEDTVDFRSTYDGEDEEPIVLPAAFPNLLANGAEGIAVGMATSVPPHNVGEICDALQHLIKSPDCAIETLMRRMPGPDFPTGGELVESAEHILKCYETGRGSMRVRATWEKEQLSHGLYQIIITEIPYQVQKSRLIEKIAELYKAKKLPLLGNIRDESAEDMRVVLEPKTRSVDPEMLMESLFKVTELESRFNLNMNVLGADSVPRVMNLKEVLQAFLDHRHVVLVRRTNYRLSKIAHRLEVLEGLLIAYLNLDEVIRIIREEDEPKALMMKKWKLTDVQVEAILNMRLRSLRRLEEIEIQSEHDKLSAEQADLQDILASEDRRWTVINDEIKDIKKRFGQATKLGERRTRMGDTPANINITIEAFVEKEPITILCSNMGWIRALKGHTDDVSDAKYKEGDEEGFVIQAKTTDKLLVFSSEGKFFTIACDKIPKGKGHGEPLRLMIDLGNDEDVMEMFVHEPGRKLLLASSAGKGFVVSEDDVLAQTRGGKQVLNVPPKHKAIICKSLIGDKIAVIGQNRKLLIFDVSEISEMKRGQGVALQKYKNGGMSDVKIFNGVDGLSWPQGESRTRTETDLTYWLGRRGSVGKIPPVGFPRNNKFND
ncbi:MAG: DNA topoisomerase IV subunit A [Alphaproteobacteria bacterium]|nr:DNA topoisomerase IV subunit A [Alphaproteobacteria bacterium]